MATQAEEVAVVVAEAEEEVTTRKAGLANRNKKKSFIKMTMKENAIMARPTTKTLPSESTTCRTKSSIRM